MLRGCREIVKNRYPFSGIFSDVDINFHADDVSTVTSLTLDSIKDSRRSTEKLPTQINQLLVDIQSTDDGELARAYRTAKELKKSVDDIVYQERMPRFTTAFNKMFEGLTYSRIENVKGKKSIHRNVLKEFLGDAKIKSLQSDGYNVYMYMDASAHAFGFHQFLGYAPALHLRIVSDVPIQEYRTGNTET